MSADPFTLALTALTTVVSGVMQGAAYDYAAQQARNDAQLQRDQAAADIADLRRSQRRQIGAIRAGAAASGLLVDDGSALEAVLSSSSEAELEQLRRKWQGDVGAQRSESEALMYQARARQARTAGLFGAGARLLTGRSKLYGLLGGDGMASGSELAALESQARLQRISGTIY